ncbi:MAG: curli-like amyloid fiber formation chaperone CsgH [Oleiphilaceae bacterium]|nr:curli-like amyloid fiber formation chaperone CsgH [Oleiphilaceae bacterium]
MADNSSLQSWIELEDTGKILRIQPMASSKQSRSVQYELIVNTLAGSGSNRTRQQGHAVIDPEGAVLSTSSVSLPNGARYEITLTVTDSESGEKTQVTRIFSE